MCSDHIREVQAHGLRVAVINSTERIPVLRPAVRSHVPADCHNLPRCQLDVLLCHDDASFSMAHHTGVKVFVLAVAFIHNLKQAAKTLTIYQQYGFSSPEQLEAAVATAYQEMRQTSGELKALETKLQGKRELRQQVLAYAKTKPIREGLKAQKSEKARAAYRQANESDFIIAEAAARYFKAQGLTKLPGRKALQAEIEQLISEKDGLYNTYHEQKQRFRELQTVKRNIDQILRREEPHRRKEQSHER